MRSAFAPVDLSDGLVPTTAKSVTGSRCVQWPHAAKARLKNALNGARWADFRLVQAGEPCPVCGQALKIRRAIEVGHVFKLGTKYSVPLNALFLDESGKQQPAVMGCYGIGITRTMQAIIEQSNDKDGVIWPLAVAPFTVCHRFRSCSTAKLARN